MDPSSLTEWFNEVFDEFDKYWATDDDVLEAKPRVDMINDRIYDNNIVELRVLAYTTTQEYLEMLLRAQGRDIGTVTTF